MVEIEKRIAALVLIVGLCWPAAVRAEVSEIDSSAVEAERVPVVAPSSKAVVSDNTQVDLSRASRGFQEVGAGSGGDIGTGKRITNKLVAGTFVGGVGAVVGGIVGYSSGIGDCSDDPDDLCGLDALVTGLFVGSIGYMVGAAIGVSRSDSRDRFISSLGGSVVGFIGSIGLTIVSKGVLWPSLFIGPPAMATYWSEKSRKPPAARRVSVDLLPNPKGGLSAVATLRF